MKFTREVIKQIRTALKNDASGNCRCTMTDLDFVCDMLDELWKLAPTTTSLIKNKKSRNNWKTYTITYWPRNPNIKNQDLEVFNYTINARSEREALTKLKEDGYKIFKVRNITVDE